MQSDVTPVPTDMRSTRIRNAHSAFAEIRGASHRTGSSPVWRRGAVFQRRRALRALQRLRELACYSLRLHLDAAGWHQRYEARILSRIAHPVCSTSTRAITLISSRSCSIR